MRRIIATGQLFYGQNSAGPLFVIATFDPEDGPYIVTILSPLTGELLGENSALRTIGEAFMWAHDHADW
jgi:hypothetical protein